MTARTLSDCVGGDTPLARLQAHAQKLLRVQRQLKLLLPEYLCDCVTVANLQGGVLTLHCASNAAAAKLKLIAPRLREGLWAQGVAVEEVKSRVRPGQPAYTAVVRPVAVREIGSAALRQLDHLRGSLPADSPLSGPLARLLEHAARRREPR